MSRHAHLLEACRVLFGYDLPAAFLERLQESGVRTAFRRRALATHPDRVANRVLKQRHTERFIETHRAYTLLRDFIWRRERVPGGEQPGGVRFHHRPAPRPAPRPRPESRPRPARRTREHAPPPVLPRRRLRFGEFLYYSRAISFETLVAALVWQRRQRDRFGEIARRWSYLSEDQIPALLAARRPLERVGETARRLRLLTDFQVRTVIGFQLRTQARIGTFFVERKHLPPARVADLLRLFQVHNAAFPSRRF